MKGTSLQHYLDKLHQQFQALREGAVADYIPELAKVDADGFGIAVVTVDGHVYQAGETRHPFTIQSISKAFTYGIALEDKGVEQVMQKIDVEPSGEAFNFISLEPETGRPRNPMINAGAIVATGLVDDAGPGGRLGRILEVFDRYAGRALEIDQAVYTSEKATGHRNRAISHMLRNYEILEADPEPTLDSYFRQCSILVTCRDLALMGATLANNGVNPITGVRALAAEQVPRVLSAMATCGMYDYSGNWIYRVGMPAKSGVGGGIVAVLPGQLSLAVFSPRLDAKGNSVRGIAVCEALSRDFGLHLLRTTRMTSASVIRTRYTLAQVRSKLHHPPDQAALFDRLGSQVEVLELSGELLFVSAEIVVTEVGEVLEQRSHLILDLRRVSSIDQSATQLLADLAATLEARGKHLLITGYSELYGFVRALKRRTGEASSATLLAHGELDQAMEWCESMLLSQHQSLTGEDPVISLAEQPLCRQFDPNELRLLNDLLVREQHGAGTVVCREGEPATRMYFLERGQVSTWIWLDSQHRYRLFAASAGWSFGESALFGGHTRTAEVVADTDAVLLCLQPDLLESNEDPVAARVRLKLFRNLADINMERLKRANGQIRILTQ